MKKLIRIRTGVSPHWVGNGFPVRSLFSPQEEDDRFSPFLLLDYAGPEKFTPSDEPRGVGEHPHRGFETVTIVYQGELEHRDSAGNHGRIGPGDVQWMTAASGVVHEEWHEQAFAKRGGVLEMIQLWVNLPAKDKLSPPRYQEILSKQIPSVAVSEKCKARVIAGNLEGARGPAKTFTDLVLLDLQLQAGGRVDLPVADGHNTLAVVLRGAVTFNDTAPAAPASLAIFDREGTSIAIEAKEDSSALILTGEPIREPIASYGPFVMNTSEEIRQAIEDFRSGRMGRVSA